MKSHLLAPRLNEFDCKYGKLAQFPRTSEIDVIRRNQSCEHTRFCSKNILFDKREAIYQQTANACDVFNQFSVLFSLKFDRSLVFLYV